MAISFVSCAGPDDRTSIPELIDVARRHPEVEWGILYSPKRAGTVRYPSPDWIHAFLRQSEKHDIRNAIHLCGKAVANFIKEDPFTISLARCFDRVQLNWSQNRTPYDPAVLSRVIDRFGKPVITQHNTANQAVTRRITTSLHHVLFDTSGGRGESPSEWTAPLAGKAVSAYAGGLNPANVAREIERIEAVAGSTPVALDLESGLRDVDDVFQLGLVEMLMQQVGPIQGAPYWGRPPAITLAMA